VRRWVSGLVGSALATLAATASADRPVDWRYQRFTTAEAITTSALLLGTGAIILFTHEREPAWKSDFLFDYAARDALRGDTIAVRKNAALIGDLTYYAGLAYPYLVDVVATAWLAHGKSNVAGQMALINTEAFAITGFLSFVSNAVIRRERPYARDCGNGDKETFPDCRLGGKSEGYFSGHTGIAATAAGLTCSHHSHMALYGDVGDVIACVATIGGALTTGYTRLTSDKHYVFDVVSGLVIGFPVGYFIAEYHYRHPEAARTRALVVRPMPMVSSTSAGVGAVGLF
jgi:membrane-associated phospholipid phosphatase